MLLYVPRLPHAGLPAPRRAADRAQLGCVAVALLGMVLVSGVLETGLYGLKGIILGLVSAVTYAVIVMLNKTLKEISAGDGR